MTQILDLMANLQAEYNTSIILITHDMGVVSEFADHILVMYAGDVVEYGDVESIFEHPCHPYTRGLLKSIPRLDQEMNELYTIQGIVPELDKMPTGCRFSNRCPECDAHCLVNRPPLFETGSQKVRCWRFEKESAK